MNLTNKKADKDSLDAELKKLKKALDDRLPTWQKAGLETRKKWAKKDPVIDMAYTIYQYLDEFFGGANG